MVTRKETGSLNSDPANRENIRLKAALNSVLTKAEENERKFRKFQGMEFELLNTDSLPKLLDKLTRDFKSQLDVDVVSLHLFDPYGTIQKLLRQNDSDSGLSDLCFATQVQQFNEFYRNNYRAQLRQNCYTLSQRLFGGAIDIQSFALVPLMRNGTIVGSYHLGSRRAGRFPPGLATDFYEHFAQIIAVCLENTVNNERLKHLILIDPLTETGNRRSLYESLETEIARCQRERTPLSLLFIDIDHFKNINDTFGHSTGDKTLQEIATIIGRNLRRTDHLTRFGGEEFTVVLPNCGESQGQYVAERIRMNIESHTLVGERGEKFNVTCSVGGTTWHPSPVLQDGLSILNSLIDTADNAAYNVKRSGRNALCWKPFST